MKYKVISLGLWPSLLPVVNHPGLTHQKTEDAFAASGATLLSVVGSQYTATRFKALVAKHGAQRSMNRRGNCYDNAHAESFWSRFKAELLNRGSFPGLVEAKLEISHHFVYYNAERRHSALGYQSPSHFETQPQTTSQLCQA